MNRFPRSLLLTLAVAASIVAAVEAQERRPLDHSVYDGWNRITASAISRDGRWMFYRLTPGLGDSRLVVNNTASGQEFEIPRGTSAEFTSDSRFVVFTIEPVDSIVKALRREDTKSVDLPKDSLGMLDLNSGTVTRVERVKSFAHPKEAGGWVAYLHEASRADSADSTAGGGGAGGGEGGDDDDEKEAGTQLVLRNLISGVERRFEHVTAYAFAQNGARLAYTASNEQGDADGVYLVSPGEETAQPLMVGQGVYKRLVLDREGAQVAFLSNRDEFEANQPAFTLYHWNGESDVAQAVADASAPGIPTGWWVSEHGVPSFSNNGERLFFGTAPRPAPEPEEETPEWEKVELDVWNWRDPLLQPNQLVQREQELQRTYRAMVDLDDHRVVQLATIDMPTVTVADSGNGDVGLAVTDMPYRQEISWTSPGYNDVFVLDVTTGRSRMVLERIQASVRLSPGGKYLAWWDGHERAWFAMDMQGGEAVNLTGGGGGGIGVPFYDELHDRPMIPGSNGSAGWTEDDARFLVYDKHDIWALDPTGADAPRNITEGVGRRDNLRFRYVPLDRAEGAGAGARRGFGRGGPQSVIAANEDLVLSAFDLDSKASGFYRDRVAGNREPQRIIMEPRRFGTPQKAKSADVLIFTRESFQEFPDLWTSDLSFGNARQLSRANPQQDEYLWGTSEPVAWTSTDGLPLQGLLFKPENFDPNRKYPMMVYYYEKNSDNLHVHRTPAPGSSSINISLYVSRGYVVFIPDIFYRDGYPGESALNCLVPGVLRILADGYVDPERIGIQGHSWGGYQNAYLVTRTNIFAAVEAGAPVSNMTSAYGGIRWQTGLSRAMQYERTQSRLGGSLWEVQPRYIDNSPIFWADKVETPVLMMHNDQDGAVPWYQGIEFFVALRRLHKPVWLLNYNGEPHGLRKYQNRKDFAIRMQQFFDHYLTGEPAPVWMVHGIPAVAKGRDDGLALVDAPATSGGSGR